MTSDHDFSKFFEKRWAPEVRGKFGGRSSGVHSEVFFDALSDEVCFVEIGSIDFEKSQKSRILGGQKFKLSSFTARQGFMMGISNQCF